MRHRQGFIVLHACIGCLYFVPCGLAADLTSCARQYGELMVTHWMTVSTLHQVERLLYYHGELSRPTAIAVRYRDQRNALDQTERALDEAASTYASLFKTKSNEGVAKLSNALGSAAFTVSQNEQQVEQLLLDAGRKWAGPLFRASPVNTEPIEPTWDMRTLVDEQFRPRRVLFGSTGRAGDNRILPLQFDFGAGLYSFIVPMPAPNKLNVAEPMVRQSDDVHKWMQKNNMGYHYWAGVYNNQNTYVADWFITEYGKNDDVWMKLADGKVLRGSVGATWGQPNIWNPHVRDYIQNYCATQSRYFHEDPSLVCYDYAGEPHPYGMNPKPEQPQYSGYNDSAVAAFREFLKHKFKSIDALNSAWKSSYSDFEAIGPPPDPYVARMERATPLSYEFELFRCRSHTDYWKLVYEAYRKHDTRKPIEAHASMYMNGWPAQAMDAYQMLKTGVADWIDMHQNNFPPNLPEQIYLYSICRLTRKVPVQFEYIWTFPRTGPVDPAKESDFRTTCQASVWRNLIWGKRVLVFFDFYYEWPGYRNGLFDKDLDYSILRSSACVIPAIKRQALRFSEMFLNTEVEEPPIIVLQPSASIWNSPPVHPHEGFSFHTDAAKRMHDLLYPHNYPFLYIPEEAVLSDGYQLSKHRVIIVPQAPYLSAAMTDALISWVRNGGTLISVGVPGIWTPYGEEDLRLVSEVFGKSQVSDIDHGKWRWKWHLQEGRSAVKTIQSDAEGDVLLAKARYGQGAVLIATNGFDAPEHQSQFYQTLDAAIGQRPARCVHDAFELTIRSGHSGRFLCVLNPDTRETREDELIVAGKYASSEDLGIGSGAPIPADMGHNETRLNLRLHPAESTVVFLRP